MSERSTHKPNVLLSNKRRALAYAVGAILFVNGTSACDDGVESTIKNPELAGYPWTNCSKDALTIPDTKTVKKGQESQVRETLRKQQQVFCKGVGEFAMQLTDKYDADATAVSAIAEHQDADRYSVTVTESKGDGVGEASFTAKGTKGTSGAITLSEINRVDFEWGNSSAQIAAEEGEWSGFSMSVLDDNWPNTGMGFAYDVQGAQSKVDEARILIETLGRVSDDTYETSYPSVVPR